MGFYNLIIVYVLISHMIKNLDYCKYTYLHRKALAYYIKKNEYLTEEDRLELLKRAKVHDMDKLTLYLFWDKERASEYHRTHSSHHLKKWIPHSRIDLLESIFDYECAALTKPDKPLNAYDTVIKYYSDFKDEYLPELEKLHMNSSYIAVTQEDKEFIENIEVDENDILKEVSEYLRNNEANIYTELKDMLCSEDEYLSLIGM